MGTAGLLGVGFWGLGPKVRVWGFGAMRGRGAYGAYGLTGRGLGPKFASRGRGVGVAGCGARV